MSNFKNRIVSALVVVVCCFDSRMLLVSSSIVPVQSVPAITNGIASQHQKFYKQQRSEQQPLVTAEHQNNQKTSSPPALSDSVQQQRSYHSSSISPDIARSIENNDKNAYRKIAENSGAGSETDKYRRMSSQFQALAASISRRGSTNKDERETRQIEGLSALTPLLMDAFSSFLSISGTLLQNVWDFSITNMGVPANLNTLIPFRSGDSEVVLTSQKEIEAAINSTEVPSEEEIDKIISVLKKLISDYELIKAYLSSNNDAIEPDENGSTKPVRDSEISTTLEVPKPSKTVRSDNEVAIKSRKKRDVVNMQPDTNLTQLAGMVLSAIQSGECMQKSICLLGNRIGNSNKGQVAFALVDKLVPESVQGNQYFTTLKKALKGGETFCDRFRCNYN